MLVRTVSLLIKIGLGGLLIALPLAEPVRALDPTKAISQFTHTSWSAKDGIPGPVRAIAQTADGYLWLGTEAGLYRFDGLRFVPWESSYGERLPGSSIWSLSTARDGSLWIGFGSNGISQLRNGHLKSYSPSEGVPGGGVMSIVEDASGSIWAGGQYGFSKFEDGKWRRIGAESGYPAPGAYALFVDHRGTLWVVTDGLNFGLSEDPVRRNTILTLGANEQRFTETGQAVGMVWMMTSAPDGELWIADTSGHAVRPLKGNAGAVIPLGDEPMCLLFDNNKGLWIGLIESGLRRKPDLAQPESSGLDHFQASDGLSGGLVYSTFKDREGNIWFGTAGGLDQFRENKVTPISAREGLDPDQQIALTSTQDGSVWIISYTRDSVRRFYQGRFVTSKLPSYSESDSARILSLSSDGSSVWVGGNFAVAHEANGEFSYLHERDLEKGTNVEAIAHDAAGNLWIAITGWWLTTPDSAPKVLRLRNGEWTDFSVSASLPTYRSRAIHGDSQGRVWLGFEDGEVALYDNETFHVYSASDGLPSGRILTITSDRAGNVWIGGEGGLSRFHQGRFVTVTKENGLLGNSVSGIIEDDDGFLWLACGLGILRVSHQELDKAIASPSYHLEGLSIRASDGMRGMPRQREPFPTATRAADGRLWFATTGGVAVVNPRHLKKPSAASSRDRNDQSERPHPTTFCRPAAPAEYQGSRI